MADAVTVASQIAAPPILERLGVTAGGYVLVTVHRAENTDDPQRLTSIVNALSSIDETVVFPVHPRTRKALEALAAPMGHVTVVDPVGYLEMLTLERHARLILTDSGGVQKEAYWVGVPCVTLRDETEWTETVAAGWNTLTGANTERILRAVRTFAPPAARPPLYPDGAAERIAAILASE